jgi:hypothetical protein
MPARFQEKDVSNNALAGTIRIRSKRLCILPPKCLTVNMWLWSCQSLRGLDVNDVT